MPNPIIVQVELVAPGVTAVIQEPAQQPLVVQLQAEVGPQGPAGPQGITGIQGPVGPAGLANRWFTGAGAPVDPSGPPPPVIIIPVPPVSSGVFTTPTAPALFDTTRNSADFAGTTRVCNTAADLAAALLACVDGDIIALAAGVTFSGEFVLRDRGTPGMVEIRTNVPTATLDAACAQGRRMTPAKAALLNIATITNVGFNSVALSPAPGAKGYRITAVKFNPTGLTTNLIYLGNPYMTTAAQGAQKIWADRCYFTCPVTNPVRRAAFMCGEYMAVVDSYIENMADANLSDSQALLVVGWQGPYKITNNRLEGWSENFMSGGGEFDVDRTDIRGVPSDLEFRYNYCTKNVANKFGQSFSNSEKCSFELKSLRRGLVQHNIFENVWPMAQVGFGILLKSNDQGGTSPLQGTQDINFSYNWCRKMANALNLAANPQNITLNAMNRIYIHNNLFEDINTLPDFLGGGIGVQLLNNLKDVTLDHNTFVKVVTGGGSAFVVDNPGDVTEGMLAVRSNILSMGGYGLHVSGGSAGKGSWESYIPSAANRTWSQNACFDLPPTDYNIANYPAGTICLENEAAVGYVDRTAGGVGYVVAGPLATAGHDGGPVGIVDVPGFFAALATVETGG